MKNVVLAAASILAVALVPGLAAAQLPTSNLLTNPGAEAGSIAGWTVVTGSGPFSVNGSNQPPTTSPNVDDGSFDPGINPHSGNFDFLGEAGGGGNGGPSGQLTQDVGLAGIPGVTSTLINSGALFADVSFWEQGLDQGTPSDDAYVALQFLNSSSTVLETVTTPTIDSHNGTWQNETEDFAIPADTATIAYSMFFIRNDGSDLDAFVDDNSLVISNSATATPEPGSMSLFGAAMAGAAGLWRIRRRKPLS
jgi:MYXO-CTERM domain-containing protein